MRAPCCDKSKVKKGAWSAEEDLRLITFIHTHGHPNWRSLPCQAGLLRCGKSCRLRWINYLRPDVKRGNFTPQEEDAIIKLHHSLGNKWSKIASHFPGRTDNEIKNVWNTHLKKRLIVKDARCDHETKETSSSSSLILSPSSSSTTTATFKSAGIQKAEKGHEDGGEFSVVTKESREKQHHDNNNNNNYNNNNSDNVFLTGQPSCCSSSSSISSHASINTSNCYDDSRPGGGREESIGEVVVNDDDDDQVMAIEEVTLECDTDFWDMLDNLEFEDQTADNNDREVECKKLMRYLENELQLGLVAPTTTTRTTGSLHEKEEEKEDKIHNINTTKPQLEEDSYGVELVESIN